MPDESVYHCQEPRAKSPNSALKILVCCHKPCIIPSNSNGILLPIQVGKALTDIDLHIQGDNEVNGHPCDNISEKNPSYAELTGYYWAWKNIRTIYPDVKYIGITHYRRYFAFDEKEYFSESIRKSWDNVEHYTVNAEKVADILDKGFVITSKRVVLPYPLHIFYCMTTVSADYQTFKDIVQEKFPDYFDAFVQVLERNNKYSPRNMLIMTIEDFDSYCEWLFALMSEAEKRINYEDCPAYHSRVFAVMAERLIEVWCRRNNKKLKYFGIYFYDDNVNSGPSGIVKRAVKFAGHLVGYIRRELIATLLMHPRGKLW